MTAGQHLFFTLDKESEIRNTLERKYLTRKNNHKDSEIVWSDFFLLTLLQSKHEFFLVQNEREIYGGSSNPYYSASCQSAINMTK